MVEVAKTQLGVRYESMHYGPKGSGDEGFCCAMFVAYCYNQVYFNGARGDEWNSGGFYGATTLFWANVAPGAEHYNHGFVEVSAEEARQVMLLLILKVMRLVIHIVIVPIVLMLLYILEMVKL